MKPMYLQTAIERFQIQINAEFGRTKVLPETSGNKSNKPTSQ